MSNLYMPHIDMSDLLVVLDKADVCGCGIMSLERRLKLFLRHDADVRATIKGVAEYVNDDDNILYVCVCGLGITNRKDLLSILYKMYSYTLTDMASCATRVNDWLKNNSLNTFVETMNDAQLHRDAPQRNYATKYIPSTATLIKRRLDKMVEIHGSFGYMTGHARVNNDKYDSEIEKLNQYVCNW